MTLLVPVLVLCGYGALGLTSAARHEPPIHEEDIDHDILKTAVMRRKPGTLEYVKRGSYKDAIKDFKKLKPTNISRTRDTARGFVGSKLVVVKNGKKKGGAITMINDVYEKNGIMLESNDNLIVILYRKQILRN